ncbi:MAG: hypothetical protein R3264_07375, partial [Anaerolineae bacterium]|nr:hypothetical protein [Anaerolineae bacterium]
QTPVYAQSVECDHTIGLEIDTADARTNYDQVKPGDTVCIEAGQRVSLKLENFEGTPTEPITFINDGGQVLFDGISGMALRFTNSRNFRITGTGDPNYQYGFKIDGGYHFGVRVHFKTSDFEIDHIEIRNTNGAGIMAQTASTCPDGSNNTHDYDNDGIVIGDPDDVVTRENFTQYNSVVHDSFFYRTHS